MEWVGIIIVHIVGIYLMFAGVVMFYMAHMFGSVHKGDYIAPLIGFLIGAFFTYIAISSYNINISL